MEQTPIGITVQRRNRPSYMHMARMWKSLAMGLIIYGIVVTVFLAVSGNKTMKLQQELTRAEQLLVGFTEHK